MYQCENTRSRTRAGHRAEPVLAVGSATPHDRKISLVEICPGSRAGAQISTGGGTSRVLSLTALGRGPNIASHRAMVRLGG